jgi:hypothetical protein
VLQVDDMINRWQAVSTPDDCPAGLVMRVDHRDHRVAATTFADRASRFGWLVRGRRGVLVVVVAVSGGEADVDEADQGGDLDQRADDTGARACPEVTPASWSG